MSKNIVVCCDGTGNLYCENNTNVIRLFEIIEKGSQEQVAYYDPGVGTLGSRVAVTRIGKKVTRILGLAFGYGMTRNIEEAYEFLMDNYNEGDKIYLFGFSRGAWTVRALGGLLGKCGILHKNMKNQVPYALKLYRDKDENTKKRAKGFKRTFSREGLPYFVGVWDTVKTLGPFRAYTFHDCFLNEKIPYGYHALAINEKRKKFAYVPWKPPRGKQIIEQVWFPGVHCDVGGSYNEAGLAEVALKWMIDKAESCGLKINQEKYHEIRMNCLDKKHNSYKGGWKILGTRIREVKPGDMVHLAVYERIEKNKDMRPSDFPDKKDVTVVGTRDDCYS
jgi:uncharacterized protein (DUF2235 family)